MELLHLKYASQNTEYNMDCMYKTGGDMLSVREE